MISYLLFFSEVRPGSVNYGELIEVKPLSGNALNQSDNTIFRFRQLRGKWALLMVDSGTCDEPCRKKLYHMRQVRLVQHTEKNRVERVWLIDDDVVPESSIIEEYKGTWLINAKDSELVKEIPAAVSPRDHIYLVDPLGNVMMRFPKNADPAGMVKDIKRLLKVSQIEHALGSPEMRH